MLLTRQVNWNLYIYIYLYIYISIKVEDNVSFLPFGMYRVFTAWHVADLSCHLGLTLQLGKS